MRQQPHGKLRRLYECLAEVREDFVLEDTTKERKRAALVRELRYLLNDYQDFTAWEEID